MEEMNRIADIEQKEPQVEEVVSNPQPQAENSASEKQSVKDRFINAFKGGKNSPAAKVTKSLAKRWFIDAFTGMALGLFATLNLFLSCMYKTSESLKPSSALGENL